MQHFGRAINPQRQASKKPGERDYASVAEGTSPREPEPSAGRSALQVALAANVWSIGDPEAYARQFDIDMGFVAG